MGIDLGFDIFDNLSFIDIDYTCPNCGAVNTVNFEDTDVYKEMQHNPDKLTDFLDVHLDFDQLEMLENKKVVSFVLSKYCDRKCKIQGMTTELLDINVPMTFKSAVPVRNIANLVNEFGSFITGPTGVGKTHSSVAILKCLLIRNPSLTYKFINVCELLFKMHSEFNRKVDEPILNQCLNADVLILDDMGTEKISEWSTSQMYLLINHRYENQKLTIVTTNLTLGQISTHLNDRIASRLSSYKGVQLTGEDKRL